jgi:hypothetical protein
MRARNRRGGKNAKEEATGYRLPATGCSPVEQSLYFFVRSALLNPNSISHYNGNGISWTLVTGNFGQLFAA